MNRMSFLQQLSYTSFTSYLEGFFSSFMQVYFHYFREFQVLSFETYYLTERAILEVCVVEALRFKQIGNTNATRKMLIHVFISSEAMD